MPKRSKHPYVAWRDGRPRFQPSPQLRLEGHKGQDLRHADGRWFSEAEAIDWSAAFIARLARKGYAQRRASKVLGPPVTGFYERGFIYFLWAGDAIKVGYSTNPFGRVSTLMTGVSAPMRMLFTVPGTVGDEKRLHRRLRSQRVRGEWFRASIATLLVLRMVLNESAAIRGDSEPRERPSHIDFLSQPESQEDVS
jgi:hypothetical protein